MNTMNTQRTHHLPIAIIGAGPIGLAAAAHLASMGETPLVLEAESSVGAAVQEWGHVRLFSPWRYNVDTIAVSLLQETGWMMPDPESFPTGKDFVEDYLAPLAALPLLQPSILLHTRVLSVTRQGFDKMKTPGRENAPFVVRVQTVSGEEEDLLARAVIDASGTYGSPNTLGANGIPALGEHRLRDHIFYGIPDVLGSHREHYAGRRVLVVGSGHSAFNVLLDLATVARQDPTTTIFWVVRRPQALQLFGGGEHDMLPARGELGMRIRDLIEEGRVRLVTSFQVQTLHSTKQGIMVVGQGGEHLPPVDEIIATTGFRPDLSLLQELRVSLDPSIESPVALAPLIDPNVHSCGTVPPHGVDELSHPERDFYIVGMKSYGRAPTFLMLTGYEQVRSVVSALTGDWERARRVELELPETGVCSSGIGEETSCCAPASVALTKQTEEPSTSSGCCSAPAPVLQVVGVPKRLQRSCCG